LRPTTTYEAVDETGRVHVRVEETADLSILQPPTAVVGRGLVFSEVIRRELRTEDGKRPVSRGQVIVSAGIKAPSGATGKLLMEINLIGYAASIPILIDTGCLSATSPIRRFKFEDVEPYTAIALEARQVYDGAPDATIVPDQFTVQMLGLFWS
jgi:hypothetical protein